jgi:hypothetical protein
MTAKPKKEYGIDIFSVLAAIDRRDKGYYNSLTEDERKSLAFLVVMRWVSSVSDKTGLADYHILMTNDIVNVGFWDLAKHPELQWLLLTCVGSGQTQRHNWIPGPKKKARSGALDTLLNERYPGLNDSELELLKDTNTWDDIENLCLQYGFDDKKIKAIKDEWNAR